MRALLFERQTRDGLGPSNDFRGTRGRRERKKERPRWKRRKNEEVAVSGRRTFTPTNYDSRRCYTPPSPFPSPTSRFSSRHESALVFAVSSSEGHRRAVKTEKNPYHIANRRWKSGGSGGKGKTSRRIRSREETRRGRTRGESRLTFALGECPRRARSASGGY